MHSGIIEATSQEEVVTCSTCKHYHLELMNRLLGNNRFGKCKRTESAIPKYDLVTGKTYIENTITYCSTERQDYKGLNNECGPKGIYWVPKNTKDIFSALKRF